MKVILKDGRKYEGAIRLKPIENGKQTAIWFDDITFEVVRTDNIQEVQA